MLTNDELDVLIGLCEDAASKIDPNNAPPGDEEDTAADRKVFTDLQAKLEGMRSA